MLKEIDDIIQLTKGVLGIDDAEPEPSQNKRVSHFINSKSHFQKNDEESDASSDSGYESVDDMFSTSKSDKPKKRKVEKKQEEKPQQSDSESEEVNKAIFKIYKQIIKEEPKQAYEFDELERSVDVIGSNSPTPVSSFEESFPPQLIAAITRAGFKKPTIVQRYAIPIVQAKRDLIAVAQTGTFLI